MAITHTHSAREVAKSGERLTRSTVMFVLPSLRGGGAERVFLTILRYLDRTRLDATLCVLDARDNAYEGELSADINLLDLRCRRARYGVLAVLRAVWRLRPDVICSTIGHINLLIALLKPLLPAGTRIVARESIVVSAALARTHYPKVLRLIYRALYGRCDQIICQSIDMQQDLVENIGIPIDRTVLIRNPVDLPRVRRLSTAATPPDLVARRNRAAAEIQLVAAGRLDHQKGFDLLIEAIALTRDPRLSLTIIGQGPQRNELEVLASRCGVAAQVHFLGFVENPYAVFRWADALVLSSRYEGLPNVILEALACGTRVIATPAPGGVVEILRGRSDCVVADGVDAASLARAISNFDFTAREVSDSGLPDEYAAENIAMAYSNLLVSGIVKST